MDVIFIANYYNHHQKALCSALAKRCSFHFVETESMTDDRVAMGWGEKVIPDYVVPAADVYADREGWIQKIAQADVVIFGHAPEYYIRERKKLRKPVFRYTERQLKVTPSCKDFLIMTAKFHVKNLPWYPHYLLCAGAYTYRDFRKFHLFKNRGYAWGYFPEMKEYALDTLMENKRPNKLLWVGRFLPWKHPEHALQTAKRLKDAGYSFTLEFAGTGQMEDELYQMAASMDILDVVSFRGAFTPEQVRSAMEETGIFLFTSDRFEGWGAVLNESMNSGCAVVASHAIGSVPYLLKDGENGCIYPSGDVDALYEKVKTLLDDSDERRRLGRAAYETITTMWNAEMATERFLQLAQRVLDGEKHPSMYTAGPCADGIYLEEDWICK